MLRQIDCYGGYSLKGIITITKMIRMLFYKIFETIYIVGHKIYISENVLLSLPLKVIAITVTAFNRIYLLVVKF